MKTNSRKTDLGVRGRPYLTSSTMFYAMVISLALFLGLLSSFIDPAYLIGAVLAVSIILIAARYPFFALLMYMTIYFLRFGERISLLGAFRVELLFGIFLLVVILFHNIIRREGVKIPMDRVSLALLVYVCAIIASTYFSEWKTHSYEAVIHFLKTILFYYYIVVLVDSDKRFRIVLWFIVGLTSLIGIEATLAYYRGDYNFVQGIMRAEGQTTYGENFNSLSLYMASTIPLLLYLMARYRQLSIKLICLSLVTTCVLTAVITGSRSGFVAIIVTGMVYIWFSHRRLVYSIVLVLMSIAVWSVLPEQYRARYGGMTGSEIDESSQGRLDAWSDGLKMFMEKPILGVGPGVFTSSRGARYGVYLASHSLYIELLATTGIVGTAAWGLFLLRLFGLIGRMAPIRGSPQQRPSDRLNILSKASYAILAGLLIAGIFGHILVRDTWYLLAALLVSKQAMMSSNQEEVPVISEAPSGSGT